MFRLLATPAFALLALSAVAQPTVYRCETNGKVAYSDAPCIGAKVIDATPTHGMDKMTGQTRKGKEVLNEEFNREFDKALRPLHGKSHEEMDSARRRVYMPAREQAQCARLDDLLPSLEAETKRAVGAAKAKADVDLYQTRKQFFDMKC